jgi:hypothetical protein
MKTIETTVTRITDYGDILYDCLLYRTPNGWRALIYVPSGGTKQPVVLWGHYRSSDAALQKAAETVNNDTAWHDELIAGLVMPNWRSAS